MAEPPAEALRGIAAAPGVAVGPALVVGERRLRAGRRAIDKKDAEAEIARFDAGITGLLAELEHTADGLREASEDEPHAIARALLRSYRAVLGDPLLVKGVHRHIRGHLRNAEWALEEVVGELRGTLQALENPALADWWRDVEALAESLLHKLGGGVSARGFPAGVGFVAVADNIGIGDAIELIGAQGAGLVLEGGSLTSHVAVLCRSAGVPAVVGVDGAREAVQSGRVLVVDGDRGLVWHDDDASAGVVAAGPVDAAAGATDDGPLTTRCGTPIVVRANLALDLDAGRARAAGLRGVGLMRTLYQYVGRQRLPGEDELAALYSAVVADFAPEPVTIRLLDPGGSGDDENLPPELRDVRDRRGIRLHRERPEVIRTQLRAICRASGAGRWRLLVPFCTEPGEIDLVRGELQRAVQELRGRGLSVSGVELGAMIEVPAAVMLADAFAQRCDFLAIGSNDLAQYLLATPRDKPGGGGDPLHPALLMALRATAAAGRRHRIPVSLCGEIASDPGLVPALLRTGLRELSVAPRLAAGVRAAIRDTDLRRP